MSAAPLFDHHQPKLLIGSCFSDEIGSLLQQNGFDCLVNPGGTLFHPLAIANLLNWALDKPAPLRSFQRQDVFLSWDLSGTFYALSEADFATKTAELHASLHYYLKKSSHLVLTFGTAWAYHLKADQQIVANCHKAPATSFQKHLTALSVLQATWAQLLERLYAFRPELKLIFTVSPVRHSKDGLVENNRSKARLHLLVEALCAQPNSHYFAAYELVLDELRDYTFFKADGVHPNQNAIAAVWQLFAQQIFDTTTKALVEEWEALQKSKAHRILYPESREGQQLKRKLLEKESAFFNQYPQFKGSTPA
ncbi:MAG: hypothetical protein RL331_1815 [Bacteroidota bacterium]|jgi:hypothetical protein